MDLRFDVCIYCSALIASSQAVCCICDNNVGAETREENVLLLAFTEAHDGTIHARDIEPLYGSFAEAASNVPQFA